MTKAGGDTVRPSFTNGYLLLIGSAHTQFHQIKSDEVVHYHDGDPANIFWIDLDGTLKT